MRFITIACAALACGCVKADLVTAPTSGGRVIVIGHLMDFVRDVPVAGAPVAFGSFGTFTDASGFYRLEIPGGDYTVFADGSAIGGVRAIDPVFRGDLYVRGGECTAAYGLVVERWSRRPVAGAKIVLVRFETLSDSNGWYRLNLGCNVSVGFGTGFMNISRAGYADYSFGVGRLEAVRGLRRLDVELEPK